MNNSEKPAGSDEIGVGDMAKLESGIKVAGRVIDEVEAAGMANLPTGVAHHICIRCGHGWLSKLGRLPVGCPRCHSPYWNRQRAVRVPKEAKKNKKTKYPIYDLEVGQIIFIPWYFDSKGYPDGMRNYGITRAIYRHQKISGQRLAASYKPSGITIQRMPDTGSIAKWVAEQAAKKEEPEDTSGLL